jgi:hypothetical protein
LVEFKERMSEKKFYFLPRPKDSETLNKLGYTMRNVKDVLFYLTDRHYSQGPLNDKDRPGTGDIYVFSVDIDSIEIYIKLKIDVANGDKIAKCISFHQAEFPMKP